MKGGWREAGKDREVGLGVLAGLTPSQCRRQSSGSQLSRIFHRLSLGGDSVLHLLVLPMEALTLTS